MSQCQQTPGAGLGTHRRPDSISQQVWCGHLKSNLDHCWLVRNNSQMNLYPIIIITAVVCSDGPPTIILGHQTRTHAHTHTHTHK